MTKKRSYPPKTIALHKADAPVNEEAELQQRIAELQTKLAEKQTAALRKAVEDINEVEKTHGVGIGLQINLPKLFDIIAHMVRTGKQEVSVPYEVWFDPRPAQPQPPTKNPEPKAKANANAKAKANANANPEPPKTDPKP